MQAADLTGIQSEHHCLLGQVEHIEHIEQALDQIRYGLAPDYALLMNRIRFLKHHDVHIHKPKDDALMRKLVAGSEPQADPAGDCVVVQFPEPDF